MHLLNGFYNREYLTTFCATLSILSAGALFSWSSPALPRLKENNSPIKITDDEGSWIVSFIQLGGIFGPALAGVLIDKVGRKTTLVITAFPFLAACILILFGKSVIALYMARFIAGIGNGISRTVTPIYLGEIASDNIRGALGTFFTVMAKCGILIGYCAGPYVPYGILPFILMIPPSIFLSSCFLLTETPYYFLMKQQEEKAMNSLKYLRGHNNVKVLKRELDKMNILVKRDQENKGTIKDLFTIKGNRKGLIILLVCVFGQQFCGSQAVLSYTQEIFAETDGILGPSESVIVIGVVQLLITLISFSIVDRMGRKPLLILSGSGVTLTSAIFGGYLYIKKYLKYDVTMLSWLPISTVLIYICSYTVGLATVPFVLFGELFPTNVKAIAVVTITTIMGLLSFAVTKLYQVVSDAFGMYVTFWGFSFCSLISLIFMLLTLRETKGKSLTEIQQKLNKQKVGVNIG